MLICVIASTGCARVQRERTEFLDVSRDPADAGNPYRRKSERTRGTDCDRMHWNSKSVVEREALGERLRPEQSERRLPIILIRVSVIVLLR